MTRSSLGGRLRDFFLKPRYPREVLEICQDRVSAVSVHARNGRIVVRAFESEDLAPDLVQPHFSQRNVPKEEPLREACGRVLGKAGISPGPITLLIPEGSVKVTIFDDFESIPGEAPYVRELVLHRLKKVLPFPLNEAACSYHVVRGAPRPVLLTMVIHTGILAQYTGIVEALGYHPGCVDIPTFNLGNAVERMPAATARNGTSLLVLNHDRTYSSQALYQGDDLVLFRTKTRDLSSDLPEARLSIVIEDLLATCRYYEDKLSEGKGPIGSIVVREANGMLNALIDRVRDTVASRVSAAELGGLAMASGESPTPLATQLLLPLVGAVLR